MKLISLKEARLNGLRHYFTGKPCKRGHVANRYVSTRICIDCNRANVLAWEKANPEKVREHGRLDRQRHKAKRNAYSRAYNKRNLKRLVEYNRQYLKANPDKAKKFFTPKRRLRNLLRVRLRCALKNKQKAGSAVRDLGCSIEQLKDYIEAQFSSDMSWKNIHLDHIKPLASFDLTDREQFLQACHYTNLQPLLVSDHRRKSAMDLQMILANNRS